MIVLKSLDEIQRMRDAGCLIRDVLRQLRQLIQPGITTREIDAAVEQFFREQHATPLLKGFPGATPFPSVSCISINDEVTHGIPGERQLEAGDLVTVDTACRLHGWCADAAWTYSVGDVAPQRQRLLDAGQRILETAIREFGRQQLWSDVVRLMQHEAVAAGMSIIQGFPGHGIGRELHEDPLAFFALDPDLRHGDFALEPGLVLAIEPIVTAGMGRVRIRSDQWTVATSDAMPCVHFEHTVALTESGPLVLTG